MQDWVEGMHASRSLLATCEKVDWMPWMSQEFSVSAESEDGAKSLEYVGARRLSNVSEVVGHDSLEPFIREFRGDLLGWVGFDFVLPEDGKPCQTPTLIEVNPRFTTSIVFMDAIEVEFSAK